MSANIMRVWSCDVSRCQHMTCSTPHRSDVPSSYKPPAGWFAGRPRLYRGHPVATGAVYLCPEHAGRGHTYLHEMRLWKADRDTAIGAVPGGWSTPESRAAIHKVLAAWFADHPHPVVDLG